MKTAKVFKNGQSEAVRLPKEFRFETSEVYIHRIGSAVMLLPINHPWQNLIDSLETFSSDYFADGVRDQAQQVRKAI